MIIYADSRTRTKGHSKSYFWDYVFCQLPGKYYWSVCKSMWFLFQSDTAINLVWKQSRPSFRKACVPKTKMHAGIKYKSGKMVAASISTPFCYQVIQQMKVRLVVLCCAFCLHKMMLHALFQLFQISVCSKCAECFHFLVSLYFPLSLMCASTMFCWSATTLPKWPYFGSALSVIFSPLCQNLGGCTLCLEMPRSLETVVHNYIVFLFLFWITEWRGKIWIRSWCESVASVTCWLLNSSTTHRRGQTR